MMKKAKRMKRICKKIVSMLLVYIFLIGTLPAFELSLFRRTLADEAHNYSDGGWIVYTAAELKAALENQSITTIYLGADINLRGYGNTTNYPNSNTSNDSYSNSSNPVMNIALRSQLIINGTNPETKERHTYTDRRTNNRDYVPLVMPREAMSLVFKDIDIYGYNYYGLLNGSNIDSTAYTIVFDGVYGVMPQFLHTDASDITVRNSVFKIRDTALRAAQEFFECATLRLEGKTVFDHQGTGSDTMFWVKSSSNRTLTVANNANVTLIERGNNSCGVLYPSGNNLILGENAKLTSILAEREKPTGSCNDTSDTIYTSGYTANSSALQSNFTFSGSEGHASVTIGAGSELNIFHPYNTTHGRDILRTTTSAGITVNEGGILSVFSAADNSRVLDTSNLNLNNPRMVTLHTSSPNNYMFNGTTPLKATKLKSIRYYNSIGAGAAAVYTPPAEWSNATYTIPGASEGQAAIMDYYDSFAANTGAYDPNRLAPNPWFIQQLTPFDVTSGNINGTGSVSSTYSGIVGVSGVPASITSANLNASQMRVVQIDGDYSRPPAINQAEAGDLSISGTGISGAWVNLYGPDGKFITQVQVANGTWTVLDLPPLLARDVYSATQQANIGGYASSPSKQVTMTVNAKGFRLIASNNATKAYMTGYLNAALNNVGGSSDFGVDTTIRVIIFNDPEYIIPNTDIAADFDTLYKENDPTDAVNYKEAAAIGEAYTVLSANIKPSGSVDDYMTAGRLIPYNCTVWAQAKSANGAKTLYDSIRWKNLFAPYKVWVRAVIAGSEPPDRLYDYEVVDPTRTYGVPYMGDGKTVYNNPTGGFDSVKLTAASLGLAIKDELVEHWIGTVGPAYKQGLEPNPVYPGVPYTLTLDADIGLDKDNPPRKLHDVGSDPNDLSKYTLNYVHKPGAWWQNTQVVFVDKLTGNQINDINSQTPAPISVPLKIDSNGNPIQYMSANNNAADNTRESFRMLGGRYTPPSEDGKSPVGWFVGPKPLDGSSNVTTVGFNELTDFKSDLFNPIFTGKDDALYIVYDTGMFQITEEYYRAEGSKSGDDITFANPAQIDTPKIQYRKNVLPEDGEYYTTDFDDMPKVINGYVPIGWQIVYAKTGVKEDYLFDYNDVFTNWVTYKLASQPTPTSNQYNIFPNFDKLIKDLQPTVASGAVTIKFYYTPDTRHNGIPDNEEGAVAIRWRGTTVDNTSWAVKPYQTVYGRKDKSILIPNAYLDSGYPGNNTLGENGNSDHKIDNTVVPQQQQGSKWFFDKDRALNAPQNNGTFKVNPVSANDDVFFDYAFSTDGINLDRDQFVTEKYAAITDADNNGASIAADTTTYILKGKTYSKMPPAINGYIYVGYRWKDGSNQIVYKNGIDPMPVSKVTAALTDDVTFLYRKEASGSVTVNWVGKTYADSEITFGSIRKTGYVGEEIKIKADEIAAPGGWGFTGGYQGAVGVPNVTTELTFTLADNSNETGVFAYREVYDEVVITAKYVSDDNSLDFTQVFPPTLAASTEAVVVTPFALNGYELTGWVVTDTHGLAVDDSSGLVIPKRPSDPVSIDPAKGSQTIVFTYKSTLTNIYIRCYDELGKEIPGTMQTFGNVSIGDVFYATAPIVWTGAEKYALQEGEPLIKSTGISSGVNTIVFNYKKVVESEYNTYIILKEVDSDATEAGTIFGYQIIEGVSNGAQVNAPNLASSYYLLAVGESASKTYTNGATEPIGFKYTKEKTPVEFQLINADVAVGDPGRVLGTVIPNAPKDKARLGEMYEAALTSDVIVRGYSLADISTKQVFVDPVKYDAAKLVVEFEYKKDKLGDVTVISYYGNDESDDDYKLGEYTLTAVVGGKLMLNAEEFPGFEALEPKKQDVLVAGQNPTVYFQYKDIRQTVTVEHYKRDSNGACVKFDAATQNTEKILVVSGDDCVINAPNITGYMLAGYYVGEPTAVGAVYVPVSFGVTQIKLNNVATNVSVSLCYEETGEVINEQFTAITVRGMSGSTVLYEYTVNRVKGSGNFDVSAQNLFGYERVGGATQTVNVQSAASYLAEFNYNSLSTDVTVKAQKADGSAVPGFADIFVPAVKNQPFSYNAPYIPGWNLTGAITQTINSVDTTADANHILKFEYAPASGNVTVILKEDDSNGRIIKTESYEVRSDNSPLQIAIPNLAAEYYTTVAGQTQESVQYKDTAQTVEYYYTKNTRDVTVTVDGNAIGGYTVSGVRIGEVSSFTAPAPPTNYKLVGDAQKLVLIDNVGSPDAKEVAFNYISILQTDLVVNAVEDGTNTLLYTYTLNGTAGQSVNIPAPPVSGYKIAPGQPVVQTGIYGPDAVTFKYTKNVSTVTVKLTLNGGDITYLAPAGYLTSIEAEKGKSYTVVAPNLTGYVLDNGQASQITLSSADMQADKTVIIKYRTVSALYITHTITGKISDGKGGSDIIYEYSFSVLKEAGSKSTYEAVSVPGYNVAGESVKTLSNDTTGGITFDYSTSSQPIAVKAVLKGSPATVLDTITYTDAMKGQEYIVWAPYVGLKDGKYYALEEGADLFQPITVSDGGDVVEFEYVEVDGTTFALLELWEANGGIINWYAVETDAGIAAPPMVDSYSYDGVTTGAQGVTFPLIPAQSNPPNVYTIYYTKDTKPPTSAIKVIPVDASDNQIPSAADDTYVQTITGARVGEMLTVTALNIPNYSIIGNKYQTVLVTGDDTDQFVKFKYVQDSMYDINVKAVWDDNGTPRTIETYTVKGISGSKMTIAARDIPGWTAPAVDNVKTFDVVSNTDITFEYTKKMVSVTVKYVDGAGANIMPQAAQSVQADVPVTITPPAVTGYMFDSAVPDLANLSFTGNGPHELRLIYKAINEQLVPVTVRGKSGSTVLYEYTVNRVKGSGNFDVSAQNLFGYERVGGATQTVNVQSAASYLAEFNYNSLSTDVTVKAQKADGSAVPGFADIFVPAVKNQPFSYNAPYIPGWNLTGAITQTINSVDTTADANHILKFEYAPASGNVTVILKEGDTNGRIIKTASKVVAGGDVGTVIAIPVLSGEFYDVVALPPQTPYVIQQTDVTTPRTVEYYYTKRTRPVEIVMAGTPESNKDGGLHRIGEVSSFTAPAPPVGFKLAGDTQKLALILNDAQTVDFTYTAIQQTDLVVNAAEDGTGKLLYTYTLNGTVGQSVNIPAQAVSGYILKSGESVSKSGTFGGGAVTFTYTKNVSVITVKLERENGGSITNLAPAGYLTSIEAEKGKSYTVVAPNLAGYVLAGGMASQVTLSADETGGNKTVTFVYRTVGDLYVTHTIIGKNVGVNPNAELYKYSFSVLKSDDKTAHTAAIIPGYTCTGSVAIELDNDKDGSWTFEYIASTANVTVIAVKKNDPSKTPIHLDTYTDGRIGEDYYVRAPYVQGAPGKEYALSGALYQHVTVAATGNIITFEYDEVDTSQSVLLALKETGGNIIKIIEVGIGDSYSLGGATDIKTLLAGSYFTYDDNTVPTNPSGLPVSGAITPSSAKGIYTFFYKKNVKSITIKAVNKIGGAQLKSETLTDVGSVGEMYTASALTVADWSLDDQPTKSVYVNPVGNVEVTFEYTKDDPKDVTVKGYYTALPADVDLFSYKVSGIVGSKIIIEVPVSIDGWELVLPAGNRIEHTIAGDITDFVKFEYVKKMVSVTVICEDMTGAVITPAGFSPQSVQADMPATILPPQIAGYEFDSAAPADYLNKVYTAAGAPYTLRFKYQASTAAAGIEFVFVDADDRQLDTKYKLANSGVKVKVQDTAETEAPLFKNYELVEIALYDGINPANPAEYNANLDTVETTYGMHTKVVLKYNYSGVYIPATIGEKEMNTYPENPRTGDKVTVVITPEDGYELDGLTITDVNGNPVDYTPKPPVLGQDGTYTVTYTQPEGGVTINRSYKAKGTDRGSVVIPPTDNGSVTVNPRNPAPGEDPVTITLTPNHGYRLKSLSINNGNVSYSLNPQPFDPVTDLTGIVYTATYTQPLAGGATINAVFEPIPNFGSSVDAGGTENGSVTVNPANPANGALVTLTITPNTGYDLYSVSIKNGVGGNVVPNSGPTYNNDGTYTVTYTQPANGATVNAQFVPSVIIKNLVNGTVAVDTYTPWPNETVKVTVTPNTGYRMTANSLTVTDKNGAPVPLTANADGTWSYVQQQGGVSIGVAFESTGKAKVIIPPLINGKASVNPPDPKPGDLVQVTITPDDEYTVGSVSITDENTKDVPYALTPNPDGTYTVTYIQPDGDVNIDVGFVKSVVKNPMVNGDVTGVSPAKPKQGETVTLTVTPDLNFSLDSLVVTDKNGNPVPIFDNGNGTWSYVQPQGGVTIDASFKRDVAVTIIPPANGTVYINPSMPKIGDKVYVITSPNYGYILKTLTIVDDSAMVITPTDLKDGLYIYTQPDKNVTIEAVFVESSVTISSTNGSITMAPANPKPGDPVTLIATPNHGYKYLPAYPGDLVITDDGGNGIPIISSNNPPGNASFFITFTWPGTATMLNINLAISTLTGVPSNVVVNNTINGSVTVNPYAPNVGDTVIITVTPNTGYEVTKSALLVTDSIGPDPVVTWIENADGTWTGIYTQTAGTVTIDAGFNKPTANIVVAATTNGDVSLLGPDYVKPGEAVKLTILPEPGFTLASIGVDGNSEGIWLGANPGGSYTGTYIQPTSGSDVVTTFVQSVRIARTANGSVTPSSTDPAPGDTVTLTIKPDPGYVLNTLNVMGTAVAATANPDGTYTFKYTQPLLNGADIMATFVAGSPSGGSDPATQADKNAAKTEINNRYNALLSLNGNRYTQAQKNALIKERDDALDAIDNATTKNDLNTAKNNGIDDMNSVPIGSGGSGSSGGGGSGGGSGSRNDSGSSGGNTVISSDNGSVTSDKDKPKTGETVTVKTTPDDGYELDKLYIKDNKGNNVAYTKNADGTYSYIQPAGDVTVFATFKRIEDNNNPDSDVFRLLNTTDHIAYDSGHGKTVFAPNESATRAEVAQMFYNLLKDKNVKVTESFNDVAPDDSYAEAIGVLASLGIFDGYPDGGFHQQDNITRAQFAAIAVRFAKVSQGTVRFSDVPASHWAYRYINTAANFGWVNGVGDGRFAPDRNITRAETVSIINKMLRRYPDKAYIDSHSELMRFSDVPASHWAYYHIVEATCAHDHTNNGDIETWK